jgi:hypothetical protein
MESEFFGSFKDKKNWHICVVKHSLNHDKKNTPVTHLVIVALNSGCMADA